MLKPSATDYWSRLAHQTQLQVLFYAHESYFLIDAGKRAAIINAFISYTTSSSRKAFSVYHQRIGND